MPPPSLRVPFPPAGWPWRIVTPDTLRLPVGSTRNTRSVTVEALPPPSIIAVPAPVPVIVIAAVTLRSPVVASSFPLGAIVRLYEPAGTVIVFEPPAALLFPRPSYPYPPGENGRFSIHRRRLIHEPGS